MEESQYKQEHNKKVAQDEGQEDKDTIFKTIEAIEAKLMELKTNPESTFNYGKYKSNPSSSLCGPFTTTPAKVSMGRLASCQSLQVQENRKAFRSP